MHITFEARRVSGAVGVPPGTADCRPIRGVEFVRLADLVSLGFSERFVELATAGFPSAGSYMGAKSTSASETRTSPRWPARR